MKPVSADELRISLKEPVIGLLELVELLRNDYVIFKKEDYENAMTVYSRNVPNGWGDKKPDSQFKAKLFNVEEIKKCDHKLKKIMNTPWDAGNTHIECAYCGKELKPKDGWIEV